MGSLSPVPRRASLYASPSRSGTWVISPIPLWEKAQLRNPARACGRFQLTDTFRNTPELSDLHCAAEKINSSRPSGTVRALLPPEAVVKQTWKLALGLLLVLAAARLPLVAAEHPIKLDKDADCASCHEDKTKGKAVHSAIAMGCTTCHDDKTEGETTAVNLTSPKDQLCFTCHDKAKEEVKHGPYEKGSCVT